MSPLDAASPLAALLRHIASHHVHADNIEAGIDAIMATSSAEMPRSAWFDAVAEALAAGYVHEPVRLPQGALQCHWQLDLTPRGKAAAGI